MNSSENDFEYFDTLSSENEVLETDSEDFEGEDVVNLECDVKFKILLIYTYKREVKTIIQTFDEMLKNFQSHRLTHKQMLKEYVFDRVIITWKDSKFYEFHKKILSENYDIIETDKLIIAISKNKYIEEGNLDIQILKRNGEKYRINNSDPVWLV